ncbi:TetR/AcrR family transcriptional regulator [Gottfriedia solisilvae]|uniref:TetR family transcriptional regulator n=1 Tax=Gottfriedia solisilvae TaxID=1516104 RepID=A0A8J3F0V7_9BACI|nr:TetR/AcrR family transcriptional regulator [Gottfriedia solisilvae]GGI12681.1 TetR family transcriptional regulator [Gottfriedia solisilvae]
MARKKEFDVNDALHKAMLLFWEQGYEKTSMKELVSQMGVHKGSMYDTFGDKHTLYVNSLEHYFEMGQQIIEKGITETNSAKEAIRFIFNWAIEQEEDFPLGCLIVNTAVELAKDDAESRQWVQRSWDFAEQLICELILDGQQSGEFSKLLDAKDMSMILYNSIIGLQVKAKTTSDREKLNKIIELNLSFLD